MPRDDRGLQNPVCNRCGEQHAAIGRRRERREVILAHPRGRERKQRQPEEQVEIGPQHDAIELARRIEQMVMVVPVDTDVDEAEQIDQQRRQHRAQGIPVRAMWHFQLQHHDRDQDCDHAIAEGLEPPGLQSASPVLSPSRR